MSHSRASLPAVPLARMRPMMRWSMWTSACIASSGTYGFWQWLKRHAGGWHPHMYTCLLPASPMTSRIYHHPSLKISFVVGVDNAHSTCEFWPTHEGEASQPSQRPFLIWASICQPERASVHLLFCMLLKQQEHADAEARSPLIPPLLESKMQSTHRHLNAQSSWVVKGKVSRWWAYHTPPWLVWNPPRAVLPSGPRAMPPHVLNAVRLCSQDASASPTICLRCSHLTKTFTHTHTHTHTSTPSKDQSQWLAVLMASSTSTGTTRHDWPRPTQGTLQCQGNWQSISNSALQWGGLVSITRMQQFCDKEWCVHRAVALYPPVVGWP